MSDGQEDAEGGRRDYRSAYTSKHPIPTIQHYREEKARRNEAGKPVEEEDEPAPPGKTKAAVETYKRIRNGIVGADTVHGGQQYPTVNQNAVHDGEPPDEDAVGGASAAGKEDQDGDEDDDGDATEDEDQTDAGADEGQGGPKDTTEHTSATDPKQRRKDLKHDRKSNKRAAREVTDPVTHLPVKIHDFTDKDLKRTPHNEPPANSTAEESTGPNNKMKDEQELREEQEKGNEAHAAMEKLFPPPQWNSTRKEIVSAFDTSAKASLVVLGAVVSGTLLLQEFIGFPNNIRNTYVRLACKTLYPALAVGVAWAVGLGTRGWTSNKIRDAWDNEVWESERRAGRKFADSQTPESTQWLNSLLASVWPLINPDLFISLSDTLEDVMQASLPKLVRMVSVEDIGQGSEALRILGVKWLPTGAAAKSVDADGNLKEGSSPDKSDRTASGEGQLEESNSKEQEEEESKESTKRKEQTEQADENVAEGMEAEEGDFVNVEIAFAYRARPRGGTSMRQRSKNAHLYLAFYLPANVKFPVWVELRGLVGVVRLRLQLTPDPPFFSLMTLTFLGQPKVDMSCVPLSRRALNIMDLPLISNFVQSAVDAAMAEYVAPKSLTLDLKDMLMGDDFKKDTVARGVLMVRIKKAFDFKEGDAGLGPLKKGSSDPYVSVGWAKFGKPVWSTRIMLSDMQPSWDETTFVLVTPQELNVGERLRVQLWDSDRTDADDDLGRIEVDLKELMKNSESSGKMWDRVDRFRALKAEEDMPGKLEWSVGYFSKTRITDEQMSKQTVDKDVKTVAELKKKVFEESERKLREAKRDESREIEQQKIQDLKAHEDQMISSAPPVHDYPSGILSIQIHQISGLELETINKSQAASKEDASDEQEDGDDLPSAYCTIILNHQKIYKTRTKPKNSKPFYNAGTEKFIRDWRNTEIHISVRDARLHENDALLGVIYLPLSKLLERTSQVNEFFPIVGGIGYGRMRVSIVFRSVQLHAPRNLLGWEFGTLEIKPRIKAVELPDDLRKLRLKLHTNLGKGKMYPDTKSNAGDFCTRREASLQLPVRKRYSSPLVIEFRHDSKLFDKTPAFCVAWLANFVDEEETTVTLPVWRGDLKRAKANCMDGECGEKVGSVELTYRFWDGLSGYHSGLASKDANIADVMDVLDTTYDNDEDVDVVDGSRARAGNASSDSSSDSGSSDDEADGKKGKDLGEDGKRGTMDQLKDYKRNAKQLHRRNRGIMQWKAPRTLDWMKTKMQHAEHKAENLFSRNTRDTGIETEV